MTEYGSDPYIDTDKVQSMSHLRSLQTGDKDFSNMYGLEFTNAKFEPKTLSEGINIMGAILHSLDSSNFIRFGMSNPNSQVAEDTEESESYYRTLQAHQFTQIQNET